MASRPFGHGPIAWLLKRGLALLALLAVVSYLWLLLDKRTLPGLRVAGQPLPRTAQPERELLPLASRWMATTIDIRTGPNLTRGRRSELGGRLDVAAISQRLLAIGHSGNPVLDLATFWITLLGGRDVAWLPSVDHGRLGRYVQAVRRNVERPPVAGATDQQGWSIAGVPGVTLDTVVTEEAIARALRQGNRKVVVPLREIEPPQALAIGSPDAVLYGNDPEESAPGFDLPRSAELEAILDRLRPREWLPSHGRECDLDPGYEGFCAGPRRVPRPFGSDADLAAQIGLGDVETVGEILNAGPKATWIEAAGRPPLDGSLLWPVPGGRLWRGFGYVRKEPYRDKLHRGVDIGAPVGTPIVAINDGIVGYADNRVRGYGNLLVIIHGDGSVSLSAHCTEIFAFPGQHVRRGQIVGTVGDTGFARGAHVHFEYHRSGKPTDPQPRFVQPTSGPGLALGRRAG